MQNDDLRICFVGDSYVNGTGDPDYLGWTGRLVIAAHRKGYNLTYYNLGVRRETSADIGQRWQQEVQVRFPATCKPFVAFALGANDTTFEDGQTRVAEVHSVANVCTMLNTAKQQYSVVIIGPPPSADIEQNRRTRRLSQLFAEGAKSQGIPFFSVIDELLADKVWMHEVVAGDGAHPGAAGYARLAALVEAWPD